MSPASPASPTPSRPASTGRWLDGRTGTAVFLTVTLGVATLLRVFRLENQSLWWDEAWQYWVSTAPSLSEFWARLLNTRITLNPPLSHLVTYLFMRFGDSDAWVRLPSVVFGVAGVAMTYVMTRRLVDVTTARWATALMAVAPFHVYYSQEARLYSLLMFLSTWSAYALVRASEEGGKRLWALYALSITASVYTHVYASLGILAHALWILACRRRRLVPLIASGVSAVLAFLPMLRFFLARVGQLKPPLGGAGPSLMNLPYAAFVYSAGLSLGPSVAELRRDRSLGAVAPELPIVAGVTVIFAVLLVLGLRRAFDALPGRRHALLLGLLALPVLGVGVVAYLPSMTFNVRYTSWAFPAFILLCAIGLRELWESRRRWAIAATAAVAVIWSVSLTNYYTNPRYYREDVRGAVTFWRDRGHGAVLMSWNAAHTVDRYLLSDDERERHFPIWFRDRTSTRIREVARQAGDPESLYVLTARKAYAVDYFIRRDFEILEEHDFPGGCRLLRITGLSDPGPSVPGD